MSTDRSSPVPNKEQIISLLKQHGEDVSDKDEFSYSRVGEGRGFCSAIYKVNVGEKSYVAKLTVSASTIPGQDSSLPLTADVHNRELAIYQWFDTLKKMSCKRFDLDRIASFYGGAPCTDKDGVILLEDLSSRHALSVDFVNGYTIEQFYDLVDQIVGFQCAQITSNVPMPHPDRTTLAVALSNLCAQCVNGIPSRSWWTEERKKTILEWTTLENLKRLQTVYEEGEDLPLTLCHNDSWPNNFLFEKTSSRPEGTLMAILDWQCGGIGVALFDVACMAVCLSAEVRRENMEKILMRYTEGMKKNGVNIPIEQARSVLSRTLRFGMLQLIMTIIFNPQLDVPSEGEEEGPLTIRLHSLLDDMLPIEN